MRHENERRPGEERHSKKTSNMEIPMKNLSLPVLSGKLLPCFPCGIDKQPMTARGFKDATSDIKLIEALWRQYPGSLVGVRTGEHSDLAVIDLDPRHGGHGWLATQKLPETRIPRDSQRRVALPVSPPQRTEVQCRTYRAWRRRPRRGGLLHLVARGGICRALRCASS
jgi:hypothetical protein